MLTVSSLEINLRKSVHKSLHTASKTTVKTIWQNILDFDLGKTLISSVIFTCAQMFVVTVI